MIRPKLAGNSAADDRAILLRVMGLAIGVNAAPDDFTHRGREFC
jgi:hypothetical protein